MSKGETKGFDQFDYIPKRFGLIYLPPQIVIEYLTPSTGKLYHHRIRLHKFNLEENITEVMNPIYKRHHLYLDNKKVNPNQILKLIEKIKSHYNQTNSKKISQQSTTTITCQEHQRNATNQQQKKDDDPSTPQKEYNFDELGEEDLNKLTTHELNIKKSQMDKHFDKNNIKANDENFVYDVRKDFNNNEAYGAEWDESF